MADEAVFAGLTLPWLWQHFLTGVAIFSTLWWLRLASRMTLSGPKAMTICAGLFVLNTGTRGAMPRIDVERYCFFDHWVSWPFVGRTLATVGEIAFGYVTTNVSYRMAGELGIGWARSLSWPCWIATIVAQGLCWMGVTTRCQVWHCFEQSLWTISMGFTGVSWLALFMKAKSLPAVTTSGLRCLLCGAPVGVGFVLFMTNVDIPMYYTRWVADTAAGVKYESVMGGAYDMMSCHKVTQNLDVWAAEIPWMTGYFFGSTLVALWFAHAFEMGKAHDSPWLVLGGKNSSTKKSN